ncbi:hypothetical protein CBM2637_A170072 [Cupriavidus taiwanensis]|nr:hypothetical protein CBM2637_A170072 [Cupriavidus taiwanensis]SPA49834.1 protein of unknown function [Cupriavidus taiwanensis]
MNPAWPVPQRRPWLPESFRPAPRRHNLQTRFQTCFLPQTSPCSSAPSRCSRISRSSSARATATA